MTSPVDRLRDVRVLVVEDDDLGAMALEDTLLDLGCRPVGSVGDAGRIVAEARRTGAEVATLDVQLNGQSSYGPALELLGCGVAVVFVTGYTRPPHCPAQLEAVPLVVKPFSSAQLAAAIARALERPRREGLRT